MASPDLLPDPKDDLVPTTINLDRENLDWLDGVATATGRNRSDALREILRNVREHHPGPLVAKRGGR